MLSSNCSMKCRYGSVFVNPNVLIFDWNRWSCSSEIGPGMEALDRCGSWRDRRWLPWAYWCHSVQPLGCGLWGEAWGSDSSGDNWKDHDPRSRWGSWFGLHCQGRWRVWIHRCVMWLHRIFLCWFWRIVLLYFYYIMWWLFMNARKQSSVWLNFWSYANSFWSLMCALIWYK